MATGMMQLLRPYDLRRGVGDVLNGTYRPAAVQASTVNPFAGLASQAILQQLMNHRDAGIFQAYINERVPFHVQNALLGKPVCRRHLSDDRSHESLPRPSRACRVHGVSS